MTTLPLAVAALVIRPSSSALVEAWLAAARCAEAEELFGLGRAEGEPSWAVPLEEPQPTRISDAIPAVVRRMNGRR